VAVRLHDAVPQLDLAAGADRRAVHREQQRDRQRDDQQRRQPGGAVGQETADDQAAAVIHVPLARYQLTNSPVTSREPADFSASRSRARAMASPAQPRSAANTSARWLTRACTGATRAAFCAA